MHPIVHLEPFYGNPAHAPERPPVFAGLEFRVPVDSIATLPPFGQSVLEKLTPSRPKVSLQGPERQLPRRVLSSGVECRIAVLGLCCCGSSCVCASAHSSHVHPSLRVIPGMQTTSCQLTLAKKCRLRLCMGGS